jgi:mono/diheme cytochrome c family protein
MLRPILFALALGAAAGPALAAGDAAEGARLARQWCSSCHVTGGQSPQSGTDMAPTFAEIAARPGRDEGWFHAWLSDPHPPMPKLELSRQQIADLIAHLLSLQGR